MRGVCLTCDRDAWIPASLVHVNWYLDRYAQDPPTNYAMFSGIAAGPSWDAAVASGLEEVIERDATMIWWLNAHRLPGVELTAELERVWAGTPTELGQRAWLIHLENEFDVPVVAGVVESRRRHPHHRVRGAPGPGRGRSEGLGRGAGAAGDIPLDAGRRGALLEVRRADRSRKPQAAPRGPPVSESNSYRGDFHDAHTLMSQLQVHLDPRAREVVRRWVDVDAVRPEQSPDTAGSLCGHLPCTARTSGFEVFAVDMTTPDVATSNLRVARVVVPGLVPNLPAAFPPFGGRRIQDAAVALGWRVRPLEERELNVFPLPHA